MSKIVPDVPGLQQIETEVSMKMRTMTALAVALFALSGAAQAETVKEIWNQGLSEDNPGRVVSPGDCLQDDSSPFSCWNDRDEDQDTDTDAAAPVEENPEPQ